ncbi:hypothetical protein OG21DRAFT_966263 [Imleria badia]|nr:hypothetical protein OG21DRAFT_966263 [Imleria badia]
MVGTPPTTTVRGLHDRIFYEPWWKPFEELFLLLGIISDQDIDNIKVRRICFRHTPDLSRLSPIMISLTTISPRITHKIISGFAIGRILWQSLGGRTQGLCQSCLVKGPSECFRSYLHQATYNSRMKIQVYSHRLIEKDIIRDTSPFQEVDLLTCPLCRSELGTCKVCKAIVTCTNINCAASQVGCKQCDVHYATVMCQECLESEEHDGVPSYLRCPTCGSWCCKRDMYWYPGRIVQPSLLGDELVELSQRRDFDSMSIVRSHPPMPSPCSSYVDSGHADAWEMCGSQRTALCPVKGLYERDVHGVYCPKCTAEHNGRRCACGAFWFCATCNVADHLDNRRLISCPRCGTTYCTHIKTGCQYYCSYCQICRRTSICFGCQAREKGYAGEEDTLSEGSLPLNICTWCEKKMCKECCLTGKDGAAQWTGCHSWMCPCTAGRKRCFSCA